MDALELRALVDAALERVVRLEPADRVLDRLLRAHRHLTSTERRQVAERVLGIALWRGRLDQLAAGDRSLWYPLFLVEREGASIEEVVAPFAVPRETLERALATPPPPGEDHALAFEHSLPLWLARRWLDQLGHDAAHALAAATNQRAPICLRANRLRTDREALARALASEGVRTRPGMIAPDALVLEGRANLFGSQAWRAGLFEVQDEASQRVVVEATARPGELVAELCAGSGGKTLGLAADMANRGRIVALDVDPRRLRDQAVRLDRAGVRIVEPRAGDATDPSLTRDLEGRCDLVVVDAPCSETGVLRRSPDARWRLSESAFEPLARLQCAMLDRARELVGPAGRIVYATCSVDRAENDEVSGRSMAGLRRAFSRTFRPDLDGCDGFHVAVLERG